MDSINLKAAPRQKKRKQAKHLRADGLVPAVLYGRDLETVAIQIEAKTLGKVLDEAGTHQLISLEIEGEKPHMTLARDVQRDVIRRDYLHVDFYAVKMDETVVAQVPIILIGEAPAVMTEGGVLTQGLDEIEIECLPGDLISSIEVSVDDLTEINDTISVMDLHLPDTVTILSEPESMVAKVEAPRKLEEVEALDEEAPIEAGPEPEVVTAADTDEEEEETVE